MDSKIGEDSRSSSSIEVCGTTQKRRRLDSTDSPLLQSSADNPCCLGQINQEELDQPGNEKCIQETQVKVNEQPMKELELSLLEATDSAVELPEAKAGMSKEITEMRQKNMELLTENAQLKDRMIHQAAEHESERMAAEKKLIELQDEFKSSKKDIDLQRIELHEAKAMIEELTSQKASLLAENQELLSKAASVDHLKEKLKSLSNTEHSAQLQEEVEDNFENLKKQVAALKVKCDELIMKVVNYVKLAASKEECHNLIQDSSSNKSTQGADEKDESPPEASVKDDSDSTIGNVPQTKEGEQDRRLKCGKYSYLVSDAKYFKINWEDEYESLRANQLKCRTCQKQSTNMHYIQDHIWSEHYGEKFECAYCEDHSKSYAFRSYVRKHILKIHPETCKGKK